MLACGSGFAFVAGNVSILDFQQQLFVSCGVATVLRQIVELWLEGFFEIQHRHLEVARGFDREPIRFLRSLGKLACQHLRIRKTLLLLRLPGLVALQVQVDVAQHFGFGEVVFPPRSFFLAPIQEQAAAPDRFPAALFGNG